MSNYQTTNNYLTFSSANPFNIGVYNAKKNWDGTLYYSIDTTTWNEWDGTTAIASAEHNGEQRIYIRGVSNSVITGDDATQNRWVLTGSGVRCDGNIENLLDYETVANGEHPTMGDSCFARLFFDWAALTTTPELQATTLAAACYSHMFDSCTGLTATPILPATNLAGHCYYGMFFDCTGLTTLPALPATTLPMLCYGFMFCNCTGIKLSTTQTDEYQTEYRIPISGAGISDSMSFSPCKDMFTNTGGTFTGTPEINTTYYLAAPVEPHPTPHDFYIVKNGVGQKQDVYLRVGDKCVKQDEYLS